jgi:aryl-alcohol dehydrogenase-like predicted oxidoreductase
MMRMRFLGKTGLRVSELCLGTMTFGGRGRYRNVGEVDQNEADALVGMALDAGINFFDTADVYSEGLSEEITGKALGKRRKEAILATKVRSKMGAGPNDIGLSRHHILEGCDASLKRLGTDYIDLYQVHSFDAVTPLEETLRALDDLVRQGKVRYVGCSNFAAWQLMKALAICDKHGWERFVCFQGLYSLVERELENELVPLCLDQGLGIITWSPLAGGFLSGKYRRGQPRPPGARLSDPKASPLRFDEEKGFATVDELEKIARLRQTTIPQAALNYLLGKPGVTSVIIGARNKGQLADLLKTIAWELSPADMAQLDKVSQPPPLYPYWFLTANPHGR